MQFRRAFRLKTKAIPDGCGNEIEIETGRAQENSCARAAVGENEIPFLDQGDRIVPCKPVLVVQ